MIDLNLQYLKYAVEVEKTGSISKAAENLYMNQPNLSKAIKELETTIGVPLFNRTTKGVSSLTPEGHIFMEYAKSILAQMDELQQHFQGMPVRKNTFRLSIPRASYIAEAFAVFVSKLDSEEDFHISCYETNALQSIQSVIRDGYDLGAIRYRVLYEPYFQSLLKENALQSREILTANSVVLMNVKNELAHKDTLDYTDLASMVEIANDDFALPRQAFGDKSLALSEPPCKKRIYVYERGSQFDLLSRMPNTFMWVSPMPEDVLNRNKLVQKRCRAEGIRFKDVLIYRKGTRLGHYEKLFMDELEQVKRTISLIKG